MKCPKCQAEMTKVIAAETEIDRCSQCFGLWFDMLEHDDVRALAEQIDTGSSQIGEKHNSIDRVPCPVCPRSQLIRMVDAGQPHIWFESCPTCYGRFYDAGEFRDASEYTLRDFLKSFSVKPRT